MHPYPASHIHTILIRHLSAKRLQANPTKPTPAMSKPELTTHPDWTTGDLELISSDSVRFRAERRYVVAAR